MEDKHLLEPVQSAVQKMFKIGGGSALVKAKQHTKVKAASKKRAGKTKAKASKSKKKR